MRKYVLSLHGEKRKNRKKLPYHLSANPFKNLDVVDDLGAKHNLPQLIQELTEEGLFFQQP